MSKITFDGLRVTYETKVGDKELEFDATLYPYNDGRCDRFRVEPDGFSDDWSENYLLHNWEDISDEIEDAYYESLK